ncbi:hypothetical protein HYW59_04050 [Candidatus Kaiserbacteria bacterium]|nr:hypothetical protein [Candidatus Kaiserbacteria bacterium]
MRWVTYIWGSIRDTWQYRHEPEKLRTLADAYWRILLFIAVLVLAGLIFYAGLKFYSVFAGEEENPLLSGGGGIFLNPADLQMTMEGFDHRRAAYESFKRNPPKIADPSK